MYLGLNICDSGYRDFAIRKRDPAWIAFRQKVWERDDYTCQYCHFKATSHMEVINLNGRYGVGEHHMNNLATACPFCTQCHFMQQAGETWGGGVLIYQPHLTQQHIHSLCHMWFCSIVAHSQYRDIAIQDYRDLYQQSRLLEEQWGEGFSDPGILATQLLEAGQVDDHFSRRVKDIRLVPGLNEFKDCVLDWIDQAAQETASDPDEAA